MSIDRREFLDLLAAGGIASLLPQAVLANKAPDKHFDDVVRIGYLPITDATPLLVAHALGYFQEQGLKVAKPQFVRGWSPLVEGFIARKFNLVHLLKPIPLWMRYNNSIPVKIVAWAHTNGSALVVGQDVVAERIADLGGKTIAVPYWYSMHNVVLQMALRAGGLEPVIKQDNKSLAHNEVNLLILPPPEMPAALLAKKIDGYIVAEPFNALGELKARARVLRFTGDMWKNHPCCVVAMHENHISEQREWSQKVVNAVVKAEIFASQNRAETARILSKDGGGYIPFREKVVDRAMNHYQDAKYDAVGANRNHDAWRNHRIDFQPWPYPSATKFLVQAMNSTVVEGDSTFLHNLSPEFVAQDLVDYTLVSNALKLFPEWVNDASVENKQSPFERTEVIDI